MNKTQVYDFDKLFRDWHETDGPFGTKTHRHFGRWWWKSTYQAQCDSLGAAIVPPGFVTAKFCLFQRMNIFRNDNDSRAPRNSEQRGGEP
jgi:hypothetical protein